VLYSRESEREGETVGERERERESRTMKNSAVRRDRVREGNYREELVVTMNQ
jgi:hypothetical protein